MLHEITDANFEQEVAASDLPCLIEFTGKWCTLCDKMLPMLEELSEEYAGKVKFCTVDTDVQRGLRIKFAVAALPFLVLTREGTKIPLFDELVTKERLQERIDYVLGGGEAPTFKL